MSRLAIPTRDEAPAAAQPILGAVHKQLGFVPNLYRLVANSPTALTALTGLSGTLAKALDVKTRERIALAVGEVNGCDYCVTAHAYVGLNLAKIAPDEIALNRQGRSSDPKADAAVRFAVKVTEARGRVGDADLAAVRQAGFTDGQIVEIVALVAENVFTNFVNNVARTEIDFPAGILTEAA
jgi:uncharacterized peroxidase-related enzyme